MESLKRILTTVFGMATIFLAVPTIGIAQVTSQAVATDCNEMCVSVVDSDGNEVGGACMDYGAGNGKGNGCYGDSNGCMLQVYCLPPVGVGELRDFDGLASTDCLNVLPELDLPSRDHALIRKEA